MIKKIIVVGGGRWGTNHIRTLIKLGSLGGVVEPSKENQCKLKKEFPNIIIYNNLEDSFSNNPEGYIVSTPAETHFEIGVKIIHNKIPLLIEKPLTLDYGSSKKIVDLAKKNNVNLMVGHVLLFHPAFNKIKKMIDSNEMGDLQYIYSNRLNLGTIRTDENVLWSFAPHDFALLQYLIEEEPLEINCNGNDVLQANIHDTTLTHLTYKNNIMAHIFVSWLHPYKEHRFVVIGSKGMIHFEDSVNNKPLIFYNKKIEWKNNLPKFNKSMGEIIEYEKTEPLQNELIYFIKHLDGKKISICNGDDAVNCMKNITLATDKLLEN